MYDLQILEIKMVTNGNRDNRGRLFICSNNAIRTTHFFLNSQHFFFGLNCRSNIRVYIIDLLYNTLIFFYWINFILFIITKFSITKKRKVLILLVFKYFLLKGINFGLAYWKFLFGWYFFRFLRKMYAYWDLDCSVEGYLHGGLSVTVLQQTFFFTPKFSMLQMC